MKRILSIILAIAMVVSLLAGAGITAFADGETTLFEVYIGGELPEIAAGETPTSVSLFDTAGACTATTEWIDDEGQAFSGTFEDGKVYWLNVVLTAEAGYLFGEGASTSIFVNYLWTDWAEASLDRTQAEFQIRFSLLPTISEVEVNGITEPVLGETATLDGITVPNDANYEIDFNASYWFEDGTDDRLDGEFEVSVYCLYLDIRPKANFDFADEVKLYLNGEQSDDFGCDELSLWAYPKYSLCEEITEIEIDFEQPSVGDAPSEDYLSVLDDAGCEIGEVEWLADNFGMPEPIAGAFEKKNYSVQVTLHAKDGYSFADELDVYINEEHQQYFGSQPFVATAYFSFSLCDTIDTIEISGVADAVLGEEATTDDITVPNDCGYTISSATWYKNEAFGAEPFVGAFIKAMYSIEILLEAEEGFEFTEDTAVTVNGEETTDFNVNGSEVYVYLYYSLCDAVANVELPAFPEIPVGEDVELSDEPILEADEYEVYGLWHALNEDGYFEEYEGTIEDGNIYAYYFYVYAKEGYEFTEDTVYTVEGANADELYSNKRDLMAEFRKTYNLSDLIEITSVNITVSKPEIGKDVDPEAYEIDKDANYSVTFTDWWVADTEDSYDFVPASGDKFEEGKYYFFEIELEANEGYFFADNAVIKINGKQTEEAVGMSMIGTFVEPGYVYIMEPFGELTEEEIPEDDLDQDDSEQDKTEGDKAEEDKSESETETEDKNETSGEEDNIAQTGDDFSLTPYIVALMISLSAIVLTTLRIRKKQK